MAIHFNPLVNSQGISYPVSGAAGASSQVGAAGLSSAVAGQFASPMQSMLLQILMQVSDQLHDRFGSFAGGGNVRDPFATGPGTGYGYPRDHGGPRYEIVSEVNQPAPGPVSEVYRPGPVSEVVQPGPVYEVANPNPVPVTTYEAIANPNPITNYEVISVNPNPVITYEAIANPNPGQY